ncbi:MAG: hypothetical protein R3B09_00365 [Nannocystaceae bacterium]
MLSIDDVVTCPNFRSADNPDQNTLTVADQPAAEFVRTFPNGLEIGTAEAGELMRAHYSHVVGILGSTNAGKTCFLVSLYLIASGGGLPQRYIFAGSETLPGFEARARKLRAWRGGDLPDQLADHTSVEARRPGFLHLALRDTHRANKKYNLLLADLPGEWSKNLIDRAEAAARLRFLQRADGVIIVVDGTLLASRTTRHTEIQRSKLLLERLSTSVGVSTSVPLVLLVSKYDEIGNALPPIIHELAECATARGFHPTIVTCAAFSRAPAIVPNGHGVMEAIECVLFPVTSSDTGDAVSTYASADSDRVFINFSCCRGRDE